MLSYVAKIKYQQRCYVKKGSSPVHFPSPGSKTIVDHKTHHLQLVFSVTPFKIDPNKNEDRSIDKVQNLGNERRYVCKDPRQNSGQRNISNTRHPKKCFSQIYRDLYGDAMLVLIRMITNMADGNQRKNLLPSFATKTLNYSSRNS